jgi:hypothetical protein
MVNTFLPYGDFNQCAKVLDNKRLGKQRVEAKQILDILTGKSKGKGWINHVVTRMWRGYENALTLYYNTIVQEWIDRGFKNNMPIITIKGNVVMPWFVDNLSINMSHRASLVRKYYAYYAPIFQNVPKKYMLYSYIWPSKLTESQIMQLKQSKNRTVDVSKYAEKTE